MREIKFRVWAKNDANPNGRMYYPTDEVEAVVGGHKTGGAFGITLHGDITLSRVNMLDNAGMCWARISNNGLELMQYTGLKDKNGKEIYEGDIVKCGYGTGKVIFNGGCFMVEWIDDSEAMMELLALSNNGRRFRSTEDETFEITGNIYENSTE